jgi:hypothetical protein
MPTDKITKLLVKILWAVSIGFLVIITPLATNYRPNSPEVSLNKKGESPFSRQPGKTRGFPSPPLMMI